MIQDSQQVFIEGIGSQGAESDQDIVLSGLGAKFSDSREIRNSGSGQSDPVGNGSAFLYTGLKK